MKPDLPDNNQNNHGITHDRAPLLDAFSRPLRDLRVSVTDRCNFRCRYCMPKDAFDRDHPFLSHDELLRFEEIDRLARIFVRLGVKKIRLTGGEPLLRRHVENLVALLSRHPIDLTLTTNASILAKKAKALRDAGLNRLTVSLDAMDDATFRMMNDVDFPLASVLSGIEAASAAGFSSIKINTVVKKGLNEHAVLPIVEHFRGTKHIVRFIEFMDVGQTNGWRMDDVVSADSLVRMINERYPIEPVSPDYRGEVARRWRFKDGRGEIGIIASVTAPFCQDCTRMRLSTNGMLFSCLFSGGGFDARALLRGDTAVDDEKIEAMLVALWHQRNDQYSVLRAQKKAVLPAQKIEMSYIGG
ncbi:MAG: GTP 3',8-cyclase MoaA [Burkholderiales bacterium]|jgi:cyclic pyranopterin phosphate synthase|nr:GTP 3',8-cyclase MoaA [Burkholderiales bacterium]